MCVDSSFVRTLMCAVLLLVAATAASASSEGPAAGARRTLLSTWSDPAPSFPFGTGLDISIPQNDDESSAAIFLPETISFFGRSADTCWVNNNGDVTFDDALRTFTPVAFPVTSSNRLIAPFWADVDTRGTGSVFYRVSTSGDDLTKATANVRRVFPATASLSASFVLVATWDRVGYYNQRTDKQNSFQLMLAKLDSYTVSCFYYPPGGLTWTTGDVSGGVGGLGGTPAQVGFDAGDQTNFLSLPGSLTPSVVSIADGTNTGVTGEWCFQIDGATIPQLSPCTSPAAPVSNGIAPSCGESTASGGSCTLQCNPGFYPSDNYVCTNGVWSTPSCQTCTPVGSCVASGVTCTSGADSQCSECAPGYQLIQGVADVCNYIPSDVTLSSTPGPAGDSCSVAVQWVDTDSLDTASLAVTNNGQTVPSSPFITSASDRSTTVSVPCPPPGIQNICVTVIDSRGATPLPVCAQLVAYDPLYGSAPQLVVPAVSAIDEGATLPATLSVTINNNMLVAASASTFQVKLGSNPAVNTDVQPTSSGDVSRPYTLDLASLSSLDPGLLLNKPGAYELEVSFMNGDSSVTDSTTVTVNDIKPSMTVRAIPDVNEGDSLASVTVDVTGLPAAAGIDTYTAFHVKLGDSEVTTDVVPGPGTTEYTITLTGLLPAISAARTLTVSFAQEAADAEDATISAYTDFNINRKPVAACVSRTFQAAAGTCAYPSAVSVNDGSSDPEGGVLTYTSNPFPGPFNVGLTDVTLVVTDDKGASSSCAATITVEDIEAPVITCPTIPSPGITISRAPLTFTATATDACGVASLVATAPTCNGGACVGVTASGASVVIGTNVQPTVIDAWTVTATDVNGLTSTTTCGGLRVEPALDCAAATVSSPSIWPPNNKMVDVTVKVPGATSTTITAVAQTESTSRDDKIKGDQCPDASKQGGAVVSLRAQRTAKNDVGRLYVISFASTNALGDSCSGTLSVCVVKDQGQSANKPSECAALKPTDATFDATQCPAGTRTRRMVL